MATGVSGSNYTGPTTVSAAIGAISGNSLKFGGPVAVTYYKMRAVDANAGTSPPTYRTWTVTGSPDYTGARYVGEYSGGSPNLTSIVIDSTFVVGG